MDPYLAAAAALPRASLPAGLLIPFASVGPDTPRRPLCGAMEAADADAPDKPACRAASAAAVAAVSGLAARDDKNCGMLAATHT